MAATRGRFAGEVTITVLIPAHNEEASLPHTIASRKTQSRRPERIIVVADNCTDVTVRLAREAGVEVIESVGNTRKKAGALNQALTVLLPQQGDNDVVMVMDADTQLDDGFLAAAVRRLTDDRALMAVGGLFYGEQGHGLIGQFQRNEYIRYSRQMRRRRGRVFVLTGTASLFRPVALRTIAASRSATLPAGLHRGDRADALLAHPVEPTPAPAVGRPREHRRLRCHRPDPAVLGAAARHRVRGDRPGAYLGLIVLTLVSLSAWGWFPFWLGLGLLLTLERLVTVWRSGWRAKPLAVLLFPELFFDMIGTALGPVVHAGILLPETVVHSGWFAVLAAFVAINTVIYASLALADVLPKIYAGDRVTSSNRRGETRSIHPETGEPGRPPSTHRVPVPDQR